MFLHISLHEVFYQIVLKILIIRKGRALDQKIITVPSLTGYNGIQLPKYRVLCHKFR